jgi:hypothetical protein
VKGQRVKKERGKKLKSTIGDRKNRDIKREWIKFEKKKRRKEETKKRRKKRRERESETERENG